MMFWINIGSFDVQEAPLAIERAFLEWVNYPMFHRGRILYRVPCESVDHGGSSAALPIRLYPLVDGDSRTFMFSTLITPRVHENAPKYSKLRLSMSIGGHVRRKDIAQLKMRETWSAAEITYVL